MDVGLVGMAPHTVRRSLSMTPLKLSSTPLPFPLSIVPPNIKHVTHSVTLSAYAFPSICTRTMMRHPTTHANSSMNCTRNRMIRKWLNICEQHCFHREDEWWRGKESDGEEGGEDRDVGSSSRRSTRLLIRLHGDDDDDNDGGACG